MPRRPSAGNPASPRAEPFVCAAAFLEHDHIFPMTAGLRDAGASVRWVFDADPAKVAAFRRKFPEARAARSFAEILDDPSVRLVAAAGVPSERSTAGLAVLAAGKDYFCDKAPCTTLAQLEGARRAVRRTGGKYAVYFGERVQVKCAARAGELVQAGAIGRVVQVLGLGPHRLRAATRPDWFFRRRQSGGILGDIGVHQTEQFLFFTGARDATVTHAAAGNVAHPATPQLQDFGEASLRGDNGATGYFRVDWLTPDGLRTWGDGRTVILGTEGYLELRKYIDVGRAGDGDLLILVDGRRERRFDLRAPMAFPFFRQLIDDCRHRTETAMTQAHAFKAAELALLAQRDARRITAPRELSERSSRRRG